MVFLTHGYFINADAKEQAIMKPYVPLGILYLSAYLEQHGVQNKVFDSTFSDFESLQKNLLQDKPRVIGIYTNLMTKGMVIRIMRFIRQCPELSSSKIVLGGPEIRHNSKNYLDCGAHMLVVGEGEETFLELCRHFQLNDEIPDDIAGTAMIDRNGELIFAAERTLIKNLDVLPMPARHKIDLRLYAKAWKERHGYSMYSISTMRGCPYTCKWCSRAVYGGTYRRRSPALVADEMQVLKSRYAPDRIWFVDDVFTISHKWLREFRDQLLARKLMIPYEIITRADRMNDEVIALLRETGCFRVWIGAESGSQRIIDAMDRRVDVNMVKEMIIRTKNAGMEAGTFIMLGYPGETRADIQETIKHLQSSAPSAYTVTVAYPITGTPLYEEVSDTIERKGEWAESSDRDLDFKRTHSLKYYRYALRWVNHEVNYTRQKSYLRKIKHKSWSLLAQALMVLS